MRRSLLILLSASAFALNAGIVQAQEATPAPAAAPAAEAAPVADLVKQVDIPYTEFTLDNGLTVIVHEDHKAPVVGVTVYYRVGSKNEPKGKTGFAHLFEHLMFGGSENVPNFDEPLIAAGSTPTNGSTWFDRTNYVETVPSGAVDLALFMEADRMGHLLGAVTQGKLNAQRGVVQNEKRQGDNQPYGLVEYAELKALFPEGHPYAHSTIGSMADLDAASLATVHQWFKDNYGPNNAILVLAGDITPAEAKEKAELYFGKIPRGPDMPAIVAPVPTLSARVDETMQDRVATTRIMRSWVVPGLNDPDAIPLAIGGHVLGGLSSSRLDNILVRDEQLAVSVTAGVQQFEQIGIFQISVDVKPGVDAEKVSKRVDEIVADYIAKGPTADEVKRSTTQIVSGQIGALEVVGGFGGKASTLAEGKLYSSDPAYYKKQMAQLASTTPEQVTAALGKWLSRPVYALQIVPGERTAAYEEAEVEAPGDGAAAPEVLPEPKLKMPGVKASPVVDMPTVETATLSNGIKVHFAKRTAVPTVLVAVSFDAGSAADAPGGRGTMNLMLSLLDEGTTTRNTVQIAEEQERLGASIGAGATTDRSVVTMSALSANLAPSLDLLADIVRNPAFAPAEVERLRNTQLANIKQELTNPGAMARRALYPALYGPNHPYGWAGGAGDEAAVAGLKSVDLDAYHDRWIRPDNATIFVAGNVDLATLMPMLEARFGNWKAPTSPKGVKDFSTPIPAAKPGIILIDRPQSPQSVIIAGFVSDKTGKDDLLTFKAANNVLGDDFLSRINTDIREVKAWSYGARASLSDREQRSPYIISAPVQADKTGPAITAITAQITDFLGPKGVSPLEFNRVVKGNIAALPGQYETSADVLGQMQADSAYGRPFDYVEGLGARYQALTPDAMNAAARGLIDPANIIWVVVGDAASVKAQLDATGLPVTVLPSQTETESKGE